MGIYEVFVLDSRGCEIVESYEITGPDEIILELGDNVTLCNGQTTVLDATIEDGSNYLWSSDNGFSSTDAIIEASGQGIYTVIATNTSGCSITDTIQINVNDADIDAEFLVSSQVFVDESFVVVQVSEPLPDTVEWIFPDEATVIEFDDNFAELAFSNIGEYEISLMITNGDCVDIETKTILVTEREPFEEETSSSGGPLIKSFVVFPNPNSGVFTLDVELNDVLPLSIKIYGLVNNTVFDQRLLNGEDHYIENYNLVLSSGIYFVLIETPGATQIQKLVIQ